MRAASFPAIRHPPLPILLGTTLLLLPAPVLAAPAAAASTVNTAPPVAGPLTRIIPGAPKKCTLRIHATGFRNQKGMAGAAVFTSLNGWPESLDKAYASEEFPISGDRALLSFQLPPGDYAVVVLHDENENDKLDRNAFGVPEEGFGFANNPRVFLKAPSFRAAETSVTCPVTNIDVKLIYK